MRARRAELAAERARQLTTELGSVWRRAGPRRRSLMRGDRRGIRGRIDGRRGRHRHQPRTRELLTAARRRLRSLQGEQPLIFPVVDGQAVAEVVESWTGIPAGRMQSDEIRTVLNLRERDGAARRRPDPRAGSRGAGDPHQPRRADRSAQADRRVPDGRHLRRRQDRDGADAGRPALWRRAEPDHHQHDRVQGGA